MKEALISLLFQEFKQRRFFDELLDKGIDFTHITVNTLDSVCDIIGFPRDIPYTFDEETNRVADTYDHDAFSRESIYLKFDNTYHSIKKIQNIEVTDQGLKMTEHEDEALALKKITEFVDWLYVERKKLS